MSVKIPTLGLRCHGLSLGFLALSIVLVSAQRAPPRIRVLGKTTRQENRSVPTDPPQRYAALQQQDAPQKFGAQENMSPKHLPTIPPRMRAAAEIHIRHVQ